MFVRVGRRWINIENFLVDSSFKCNFFVIYAPNIKGEIRGLWEEIKTLKEQEMDPMLAMGDFNEDLHPKEKKRGAWMIG